jgi:hypothetical protein
MTRWVQTGIADQQSGSDIKKLLAEVVANPASSAGPKENTGPKIL